MPSSVLYKPKTQISSGPWEEGFIWHHKEELKAHKLSQEQQKWSSPAGHGGEAQWTKHPGDRAGRITMCVRPARAAEHEAVSWTTPPPPPKERKVWVPERVYCVRNMERRCQYQINVQVSAKCKVMPTICGFTWYLSKRDSIWKQFIRPALFTFLQL